MYLCEDFEQDIISKFQDILDIAKELKSKCTEFKTLCEDNEDLKFQADYLYDFCKNELGKRLEDTKNEILDIYYPIDYADDEDDFVRAGEIQQDSKETRDRVFKN